MQFGCVLYEYLNILLILTVLGFKFLNIDGVEEYLNLNNLCIHIILNTSPNLEEFANIPMYIHRNYNKYIQITLLRR